MTLQLNLRISLRLVKNVINFRYFSGELQTEILFLLSSLFHWKIHIFHKLLHLMSRTQYLRVLIGTL